MRERRQQGITIGEICDWYLDEAKTGRLLGRRGRPIKPSTLSTDWNRIEAHVRPLLGKRSVQSLTVRDFEQMQADIAARKTAADQREIRTKGLRGGYPKGGAGTAGRTLGMLRAILEHATRKGMISINPARGSRRFADQRRRTRLDLEQIRKLGRAISESASDGENPTGLAAIRLILVSGFRRSEALSIRRQWLVPGGGIDFPDTKSGPQIRPIGRAAMDILIRRAKVVDSDWLFPADHGDGHFVGLPKVLARVLCRAKLKGITAHGLRHTFASVAGELGFSELTIAGLLGHASGSVTSRYVHLDAALVSAADRVSTVIADALDGKETAKVFPFRAGAG
jgi:integrase